MGDTVTDMPAGGAGPAGGISTEEIAKFSALASSWWEPRGPMRPLHAMNPLRCAWIAGQAAAILGQEGGRLLDVGCGGGLAAEALADLGFDVLGLDAAAAAIAAARAHAALSAASKPARALAYRCGGIAELIAEGASFDLVTALEVIEHVPDQPGFVAGLARLVRPGGALVISTLNRTLASLAVAKIGAEYVVRLLPRGTHDWQSFVPPEQLASMARASGLRLHDITGLGMRPGGTWALQRSIAINYLAAFVREF